MSYSDDEFPDLCVLLGMPKPSAPSTAQSVSKSLRRSPRRKTESNRGTTRVDRYDITGQTATASQTRRSPGKPQSPTELHGSATLKAAPHKLNLGAIPSLPRKAPLAPISASSNNRSSPRHEPRPIGLLHVDSLPLPLSKLAMQSEQHTKSKKPKKETARSQAKQRSSRFVLSEARCNNDEEDSVLEDDEDEETDLSGFIVDDNADLSYEEWSDTQSVLIKRQKKVLLDVEPQRRLQRGSPRRRRFERIEHVHDEVGGDTDMTSLSRMQDIDADAARKIKRNASIEIVDLTQCPEKERKQETQLSIVGWDPEHTCIAEPQADQFDKLNKLFKLPPPRFDLSVDVPQKQCNSGFSSRDICGRTGTHRDGLGTPPTTPPPSPSRLRSPSKLLSPSKRDIVPRSPHRQSMDAFWDLHTINSWHDQYSPKKAPVASPGKRGLARFQIWSDDSADEDTNNTSSSSLPSPCSSPTKPRSPLKSPQKEERRQLAAEKKASRARKAEFDRTKERMALELFDELDNHITSSKLATLSASTGGVKIVWSKTLRSTAGRANWRRTVTKSTNSPIKGNTIETGPGVKVEHFANIELAAKVIDSEDRLVNTLAHEFCHLANFMVSNVRDQPHGASFKAWAKKVTSHLQRSENELWKKVEVTTKHSYKIDHKYLWLCVGRERSKAADFLNLPEDGGCGAEYGRHSRSIDTEKQRCGRCKGKLAQVRPKPRESPVKKAVANVRAKSVKGQETGQVEVLEQMMETIDLSD